MRGPHNALQVMGAVVQSSSAFKPVAGTVLDFLSLNCAGNLAALSLLSNGKRNTFVKLEGAPHCELTMTLCRGWYLHDSTSCVCS